MKRRFSTAELGDDGVVYTRGEHGGITAAMALDTFQSLRAEAEAAGTVAKHEPCAWCHDEGPRGCVACNPDAFERVNEAIGKALARVDRDHVQRCKARNRETRRKRKRLRRAAA